MTALRLILSFFALTFAIPAFAAPANDTFYTAVGRLSGEMSRLGLIHKRNEVRMKRDLNWDESPQWGQAFTFKDGTTGEDFTFAFFPIGGEYSASSKIGRLQQAKLVTITEDFIVFRLPPFNPREDVEKIIDSLKFTELEAKKDVTKEADLGFACEEAMLKKNYLKLDFSYRKGLTKREIKRLFQAYGSKAIVFNSVQKDRFVWIITEGPVRTEASIYSKEEVKKAYDDLTSFLKGIDGYKLKTSSTGTLPPYEKFDPGFDYSPRTLTYLYLFYTNELARWKGEFAHMRLEEGEVVD